MNLEPRIYISNWVVADGLRLRGYADDGEIADLPAILPDDFRPADPLMAAALPATIYLLKNLDAQTCQTAGIILGTMFGCLETDVLFEISRQADGGRYASPAAFSRTLPTTLPGELAIRFNLRGPGFVVSAGSSSTLLAVARACRWLQTGVLTHCLTGGFDWRNQTAEVTLLWLTAAHKNKEQLANTEKPSFMRPSDAGKIGSHGIQIITAALSASTGGDQPREIAPTAAAEYAGNQEEYDASRRLLNAALLDTSWREKTLTLNWKAAISPMLSLKRQAANGDL